METELTDLALDGYRLVLRHRSLPFVSYPYEWCDEMLKDAVLLLIDLEMKLTRHGLTLVDASPWNVVFDGSRPVFVDFTSFLPAEKNWTWNAYDGFCRYYIHPLQLMAHGRRRTARSLLQDSSVLALWFCLSALILRPYRGFARWQTMRSLLSNAKHRVPRLIPHTLFALLHGLLSRPLSSLRHSPLDFLEQLRQWVAGISIASLPVRCSEDEDFEGRYPPLHPCVD